MRLAVSTEQRDRSTLLAAGLQAVVHLTHENDPRHECIKCRQICYFSAVVCKCEFARKRVSCLRHSLFLCSCPTSKKMLAA